MVVSRNEDQGAIVIKSLLKQLCLQQMHVDMQKNPAPHIHTQKALKLHFHTKQLKVSKVSTNSPIQNYDIHQPYLKMHKISMGASK